MGRRLLLVILGFVVATIATIAYFGAWPRDSALRTSTTTTIEAIPNERGSVRNPFAALRSRIGTLEIKAGSLRLEGQVIDSRERPVAGAVVTLGGARETITEADGSFVFDGLSESTYAIAAAKLGAYAEDHNATLSESSDPVILKLRAGATLTVHVIAAETGAPIAGAKVETTDRVGVTDASGNVELRTIDSGTERVEASAAGRAPVRVTVSSDDPALSIARTIELPQGAAASGTVRGPDGKPVPEALVIVEVAGGDQSHWIHADTSGQWRIESLPGGRHTIKASSDRTVERPEAMFDTDGVHARTDIDVHTDLGATISGLVVDHTGKPVVDAHVSTGGGSGRSDAQGRFSIGGLGPGDYEVSASTDLAASSETKVTLERARVAEVRLVVVPSSLAGIVVDDRGNPVVGAVVSARHVKSSHSRIAVSDDYGKFDFGGIEAGDYAMAAERERMQQHDAPGQSVKSGNRAVRLVVDPVSTIVGRVVLDGKPVANYGIAVANDPDARHYDPVPTRSPDGRFERTNLGPGTWHVIVVGPEFTRKVVANLTVPRNGTLDLGDITVERGRVVTGRVVDERGGPVAGAVVSITSTMVHDDTDQTLSRRMAGDHFARTGTDGRYAITGVDGKGLHAGATHALGIAPAVELADGVTTLDLTLVRSGSITGRVANIDRKQHGVSAISDGKERAIASIDGGGAFNFPRLPAGEYDLKLTGTNTLLPLRVVVVAGARQTVELALPARPITLSVACGETNYVSLLGELDNATLAFELCKNGSGNIEGVSPGRYRVCGESDRCWTIEVPVEPVRQSFAIPSDL